MTISGTRRPKAVARRVPRRKSSGPTATRSEDNRRRALLDVAARLFGTRGFDSVSIRDITKEVGMLPGSLYYHFSSKEELFLAVHEQGVTDIRNAVLSALEKASNSPWERLQSACTAHLQALLGANGYSQVISPQFPKALPSALRATLIAQRDSYERVFGRLIEDLPISPSINKRVLRLALLGSLNWTLTWYHPKGDTPAEIAEQIFEIFRNRLDSTGRR